MEWVSLFVMEFPNIILYAIPFFILTIIAEYLIYRIYRHCPWWRLGKNSGGTDYDIQDGFTSVLMGLGSRLSALIGGAALVYFVMQWFYQYRFINDMMALGPPLWLIVSVCFLLDDFAYYWFHRVSHERRWFWASHVVHHSSQRYNLTTALRQTWTGRFSFTFIFSLPLVLIGFPPEMVLFVGALNLVYQYWIHTELIDRLGPLEWILNTPSHHRVHHAVNPDYLDSNYAGTLIIWDRIFGTFVAEKNDQSLSYGIVQNINSYNPLKIAFHEWMGIIRDVRSARSIKEMRAYLFGPPGWSPDGSRFTSAQIKEQARKDRDRLIDQEK